MSVRRTLMLLAVAALAALTASVGPAQSAFPGANGRIVFSSGELGAVDVYSMAADGSGRTQLTTTAGDDEYPMWSHDGNQIVFSSRREGISKIFTMNAAGTVAPARVTNPTATVSGQGDEEPSWSRNGDMIAFRSDRELGFAHIWKMRPDGTGLTRLTDVGDNLNPVWSPTADRIAFTSDRDGGGDWEIFSMDASGGGVVQHTTNDHLDSNPDWSPDGTRLAFQSFVDGQFDLYVLHLPSGTLSQLTNDPAFDTAPAWSPDGTKLAFQSNRDGDWEIFSMSAAGTGVAPLTNNTVPDRVADWQPLVGPGDTTPPVLTLPGFVTVDATSPAGASVTYGVSVSDAGDPDPAVVCTRASGATFPVGTTTVSCTATDAAGNSTSGSFPVTVRSAQEQLVRLLDAVISASALPPTQKAQLLLQLQRAAASFDPTSSTQRRIVCNALRAFEQFLGIFGGRGVPIGFATLWRADSARIRAVIGSGC